MRSSLELFGCYQFLVYFKHQPFFLVQHHSLNNSYPSTDSRIRIWNTRFQNTEFMLRLLDTLRYSVFSVHRRGTVLERKALKITSIYKEDYICMYYKQSRFTHQYASSFLLTINREKIATHQRIEFTVESWRKLGSNFRLHYNLETSFRKPRCELTVGPWLGQPC